MAELNSPGQTSDKDGEVMCVRTGTKERVLATLRIGKQITPGIF